MKLTCKFSMGALMLIVILLPVIAFAGSAPCGCYCNKWLPPPCSDSACKAACGYKEPGGGGYTAPPIDYEAERQQQEMRERNARIEMLFKRGSNAWDRKSWEEAIAAYTEVLKLDPGNKSAARNLNVARANAANKRKDWLTAEHYYKIAIGYDPDDQGLQKSLINTRITMLFERGSSAWDRKSWDEASAAYAEVLKLDPGDKTAARNINVAHANAAKSREDWLAAENYYKTAIEYAPDDNGLRESLEYVQAKLESAQARKSAQEITHKATNRLISRLNSEGIGSGSQLKSAEGHSRDATRLDKEAMSEEARKGFDTAGENRGTIAVPKISGTMPTLLDEQVPEGARNDPQVKQMLDWYRQLEGIKAEVTQKIATLKKQQETSKDPLLAVKIESLNNDLKQYTSNQAVATQNAKKRSRDLGFGWNEIGETKQQEGAKK